MIVKKLLQKMLNYLKIINLRKLKYLFWRNSNLNFNNALSLIKSLEEKPNKNWLRKIHECEDEKVLKYFLKDMEVHNIENNQVKH